jgi:hypothetical protein
MYDDQGVQKKELKIDHQPTDITKVNDLTVAVATSSTKVYLLDPKLLSLSRIFTIDIQALTFVCKVISFGRNTLH